jgi:hypothetical protein
MLIYSISGRVLNSAPGLRIESQSFSIARLMFMLCVIEYFSILNFSSVLSNISFVPKRLSFLC